MRNFSPRERKSLKLQSAPPPALGMVVAVAFIVVETAAVAFFNHVDPMQCFEALYLPGVLVVSTMWGMGVATATSLASAIALAYFHDWPTVHWMPLDLATIVIIVVFLAVALLTNFVAGTARARALEARVLTEHQTALRHVATLVARGAAPSEVFSAVAQEMARCLHVTNTEVVRYDGTDAITILACYSRDGLPTLQIGERLALEDANLAAMVLHTGRAARIDYGDNPARRTAARVRELGIRAAAGAPITVDGRVWGAAFADSRERAPLPRDTESRISDFADLVATAIANAATRADLIASRARIVAAIDDARRRIERDLHDGAQQRLVSLGLHARGLELSMPSELNGFRTQVSDIASGLTAVSDELRRISRGIHPAILSQGGLAPALKSLARHSAVPVDLHAAIKQPLPDSVEVAAYYVVAEALTNAAKHAQASQVAVHAETTLAQLDLSIRDDGIGGANSSNGSGLTGLKDRVEALGGQMHIDSRLGTGTSLRITIPIDNE
jgi:signal transduction histidine kinase